MAKAAKKSIDLSTISFEEVIVHTLPKHKKNEKEIVALFSEDTSKLSDGLRYFFKDKIINSLSGTNALKLVYDPTILSPISSHAKDIIRGSKKNFVEDSKKIAKFLFEIQMGSNNEGILVIISCTVNTKRALILIKLEMDSGAQLILNKVSKSYDIKEIFDLMLTKKTKIYKITLLLDKITLGVDFDSIVADHQIDTKAKYEVKSWFINKFLGCKPYNDPKITTQNFYNYTKTFIDTIEDDVKRTKYHQDLNSYILKNSATLSPTQFAEDYLSLTTEQNNYKSYLTEKKFSFDDFIKDTSQIEARINKMTVEFANGIIITGSTGTFENNVKFEKLDNGQTKAEITSRVKKIK